MATQPAAATPIFEFTQQGKIYVFGSVDDMQAFQNGKSQALQLEKPELNPGHQPVVIEACDQDEAARLSMAYCKLHPAPK